MEALLLGFEGFSNRPNKARLTQCVGEAVIGTVHNLEVFGIL